MGVAHMVAVVGMAILPVIPLVIVGHVENQAATVGYEYHAGGVVGGVICKQCHFEPDPPRIRLFYVANTGVGIVKWWPVVQPAPEQNTAHTADKALAMVGIVAVGAGGFWLQQPFALAWLLGIVACGGNSVGHVGQPHQPLI